MKAALENAEKVHTMTNLETLNVSSNTNKTIKASVKKYNENTGDYEIEFIDNDTSFGQRCDCIKSEYY